LLGHERQFVTAGLVPAIPMRIALCSPKRDCRDEPGNDNGDFARGRAKESALPIPIALRSPPQSFLKLRKSGGD
jgi:hypothetical protein